MVLKNYLIVVEDIEVSKAFYRELFGLQVVTDFGENVILSGGLVLQEKKTWESLIGREMVMGEACAELYFEETDMQGFMVKLETCGYEVRYCNSLMRHAWGQEVVRIYDPDGHMIEVGTPNRMWKQEE